ncbi:hypothetical protein HY086_04015 [Candidatus Gottesmanbacteria bacterium]|nr:hypothetical protein [Candidatus Gottesmanbacteria bacterium]
MVDIHHRHFFRICVWVLLGSIVFVLLHSSPTVALTKEGITPQVIFARPGDTVVFRSMRHARFWPITINNSSLKLDSVKPIAAHQLRSIVIPTAGQWWFVNRFGPRYSRETGLLIVSQEGSQKIDPERLCHDAFDGSDFCIEWQLRRQIKKGGIALAMVEFQKRYAEEPAFRLRCNDYTRRIGGIAYKLGRPIREIVASDSLSFCNFGFLIGYVDALFALGAGQQAAVGFCNQIKQKTTVAKHAYMECIKSIGQALVEEYHVSLRSQFVAEVAYATGACERIAQSQSEKNICIIGVMSGVAADYQAAQKKQHGEDSAFALCDAVAELYQPHCFGGMAGMMIYSGMETFESAFEKVPEIRNREGQIRATRAIAKISYNKEHGGDDVFVEGCRRLPNYLSTQCFISLVQGAIELGKPGKEYEDGFTFCRNNRLTAKEQKLCVQFVLYDVADVLYGKEKVVFLCSQFDSSWREHCKDYEQDFFSL